jgi:hypothetical protein
MTTTNSELSERLRLVAVVLLMILALTVAALSTVTNLSDRRSAPVNNSRSHGLRGVTL